ncbi:MAG: alkaline phosphatase family protein [Gammaproteobacteria bacterium]|nr:alkaline phosphatase family protein [Gammaproteobacteria bacterium]
MADLILGPLLRYVDAKEATLWVETDAPCEVQALGHRARTFAVEGHHYALVCIADLEPATRYEYTVELDGRKVWPGPNAPFAAGLIRSFDERRSFRLAFGSCRVAMPLAPPYTLTDAETVLGYEIDALYALSRRLQSLPDEDWPHALLLLGDQVYADEVAPTLLEFMRARRSLDKPPGKEIADFEEYTRLYRESWTQPDIRWLLANLPSAMIFDDHDVNDDWNISAAWARDMQAEPWWRARIVGAFMSYWLYQHLGNLSPRELAQDDLYQAVHKANDAGPLLREFAESLYEGKRVYRWSFYRDFGKSRLVVMDSRAGRVLEPERRAMVSPEEWDWIRSHAEGEFDHLLLGTSVPLLMGQGIHYLEAWNEALCRGAWGKWAAQKSERIRRAIDLDHWPAFQCSFRDMVAWLQKLARGARAPASIIFLSGDVHHTYLVEARLAGEAAHSRLYQAVCSPYRNPLDKTMRRAMRSCWSRPLSAFVKGLALLAGVKPPGIAWRRTHEKLWFDNVISELAFTRTHCRLKIEKCPPGDAQRPQLEEVYACDLVEKPDDPRT